MIDVKHYLYHRGSGKSNAAKEQGKAHYELYKATLQECKDNLSKPETHDDLAIRMRAFFPDDEGRRIYQKGLARILYPKVLPVIDKRLPQPKVLPPAYESGAKRGASSVDDEAQLAAEQRKQARRDEAPSPPTPLPSCFSQRVWTSTIARARATSSAAASRLVIAGRSDAK